MTRKGGDQVILYYGDEVKEAILDYIDERKKLKLYQDMKRLYFYLYKEGGLVIGHCKI